METHETVDKLDKKLGSYPTYEEWKRRAPAPSASCDILFSFLSYL